MRPLWMALCVCLFAGCEAQVSWSSGPSLSITRALDGPPPMGMRGAYAARLKWERERLGLTLLQVAGDPSIEAIEAGLAPPPSDRESAELIRRIARATGSASVADEVASMSILSLYAKAERSSWP